ncbi:MAG: lipid carrier--UDP-N-acetylgalactosaminyltransferase [Mesorhizobium amorphae]|nr:MAG: lipid carrier--UDP-N-acetylgalactosaminyltransferase [Mesorhizobium amorphae]
MIKRLFDFTAAGLGLLVLAPVIGCLALLIRRDSPGPAIFAQKRVGREGRVFTCFKLRTMRSDTPDLPTHLASASSITRLGAVLRRTKLDELPQLWNVLWGEMSLVGPRPCLPTQELLVEERRARGVLALRPGITGLAQVDGIDMSDPVRLARRDADYLQSASFAGDILLLFKTFLGRGGGDRVRI